MSLIEAFEAIARNRLSSPALAWRQTVWTYGDLCAAIAAVRRALARRRLVHGARIAFLFRNSPHAVALYYGAMAAGCVAVPLNVQESEPVLMRQIRNSAASLLVGDPNHPEWNGLMVRLTGFPAEIVELPLHEGSEGVGALARALDAPESGFDSVPLIENRELAAIVYTSGTTGHPKGVMLSHGNLHANAASIIDSLQLTSSERGLIALPLTCAYGTSVLNSHLLCGARLALEETFAYPQMTLQRLQDDAITGFAGVPSTFAMLLGRYRLEDFDLSRLRYVTQAGGAMPRPLLERLRRKLPHARVYVMYGQTEATARLTCLPPADLDRKPGSVGVPIAGVEIDIRADNESVPPGEVGEICARGPSVMLGYWNDPAATAEVLRGGWLRTGDLGRVDEDGHVYVMGRRVEMIKVGAFRISPQEVEDVIAALDGVQEVAVAGAPDDLLGQVIKAVVVPRPGAALTNMTVRAHCRQHLAHYKVPKTIEFADALPRTASGKVQRMNLARLELTHEG